MRDRTALWGHRDDVHLHCGARLRCAGLVLVGSVGSRAAGDQAPVDDSRTDDADGEADYGCNDGARGDDLAGRGLCK